MRTRIYLLGFGVGIGVLAVGLGIGYCGCGREREPLDRSQVVARTETIAQALRLHFADHGRLPDRLHDLIPTYLSSPADLLILPPGSPQHAGGMALCYLPKDRLTPPLYLIGDRSPERWGGTPAIAFTSAPINGEERFVIDEDFQVWSWGEGALVHWLLGKVVLERGDATHGAGGR